MEGIDHKQVEVNRIKMHVAEKGEGPVVLFIHGFPELWYSMRPQMVAVADHGYKAIAPDLRGYGDTDVPAEIGSYTCFHIVGDLISLIDHLAIDKVYVVGHDWGSIIAWYLCLFRPDRVKALVNLSLPFLRRNPYVKTVDGFHAWFGYDYYICRFQERGVIEKEFSQIPAANFHEKYLSVSKSRPGYCAQRRFWCTI